MKIRILGPLNVTDDDDAPIEVPLEPKQEILLLTLAANADRGVSMGELVVALYASTETALYKRSVESLVSRLRATLRAHVAADVEVVPRARGSFYTARLSVDQVDALRFLRIAEHVLTNWAPVGSAARDELVHQALSEWRDNPVRVYDGACAVAAELFRRYTSALAELGHRYGQLLLDEERYEEASQHLDRMLELLPAHSGIHHLREQVALRRTSPTHKATSAELTDTSLGEPAVQELCARLIRSRFLPLDALSVTAHNLDRIHLVDRVAPDHEVTIDLASEQPGGSGANTSAALARLGAAVAVAGVVADDQEGRVLVADLAGAGVNCENVLVLPTSDGVRSGHSIVFSDPRGVRSIYVHPGVNEFLAATLEAAPGALARLEDAIRHSRIVHFTSFTSPAELALQERFTSMLAEETVLSLNPGALYASLGLDRLGPILSRVNILFLYEQNLRELIDNSAAPSGGTEGSGIRSNLSRLYAWKGMNGYDQPMVTLVKRYRSELKGEHRPEYLTIASGRYGLEEVIGTQARIGFRNQSPVTDSTGAGDGMAAALHFGLLRGASLAECADLAFLLATMVSDHVGARAGQPTRDDLGAAWQHHFPGVAEPRCLTLAAARGRRPHPSTERR
ncbi:MAG TPA: PfkB family carbohydrate kinase [Acidimicrobiales bacterium]|nr:PfkB family carbohydrate kinase [Acidimicrobiales bacterium]